MEDLKIEDLTSYINSAKDDLDSSIEENKNEIDNVLKDLQDGKIDSLKEAIEDIQELIIQRKELSDLFSRKVKKIEIDISNFISEAQSRIGVTDSMALKQFVSDIVALKAKGVEIGALDLKEQIDCWRDIALLKKELRDRIKEYKEKESRINILDEILEK